VIPTDNLRILNPPIVLEERGSVNQTRGLIGTFLAEHPDYAIKRHESTSLRKWMR
jgi:hypothetical protein